MGLCENCKITMCREEMDDGIGCAEFVAKDTNVLTNADRIRAMSDEELANIMAGTPICKERYMDCIKDGLDCEACLLEWLKQSTKGE